MFHGASAFNQILEDGMLALLLRWSICSTMLMYYFLDIGGWDVSSVTSIYICEHSISQLTYTSSDDAICKSISINLHTIIIRYVFIKLHGQILGLYDLLIHLHASAYHWFPTYITHLPTMPYANLFP